MLKGSNRQRLEQEIANLIYFISRGRNYFFKKTGNSLGSSDKFISHFVTIDLFQNNKKLIQLDLNIQLLYIKLSSYYSEVSKDKVAKLKLPRNVFAHHLTDIVFKKRVQYNFFLYKVSENFKKIKYLFYSESLQIADNSTVQTFELNLHDDINDFLLVWEANGSKSHN